MFASPARARLLGAAATVALLGSACRHSADFMWVDAVPAAMLRDEARYEIGPGDVVGIRVFNQEANSVDRVRVRDDGKVALPLLNEVEVAGWEPGELARRLEVKLKEFIMSPAVTVVVHERHPLRVSVVGKVARPGVYDLDRGSGVVHALAAAGGLTPFADGDGVFVLRSGYWADGDPAPARIRFRYRDLLTGKIPGSVFTLRSRDVVVVE